MKILKFNESFNIGEPKLGDYAICIAANKNYKEDDLNDFISENIGIIVVEKYNNDRKYPYVIKYENLPSNLIRYTNSDDNDTIPFKEDEIIYWSENKEELESIIESKKFNI